MTTTPAALSEEQRAALRVQFINDSMHHGAMSYEDWLSVELLRLRSRPDEGPCETCADLGVTPEGWCVDCEWRTNGIKVMTAYRAIAALSAQKDDARDHVAVGCQMCSVWRDQAKETEAMLIAERLAFWEKLSDMDKALENRNARPAATTGSANSLT